MPRLTARTALTALAAALAAGACADRPAPLGPTARAATSSNAADNLRNGAVYTQTDQLNNSVVAFYRDADGTLQPAGTFPTGGAGSGGNLAGQGSVVLSGKGDGGGAAVAKGANHLLFVTNAGSNTLSVFRVEPQSLTLVSSAPTNGQRPISVAVYQDLVYVVNQTTSNITGFRVSAQGELTPIPGSTRSLSSPTSNPAQVGFSPHGDVLVTEGRESQIIDTYVVDKRTGLVTGPHANATNGAEPFSFTFDSRDHLFMSEGHVVAPLAGSTSSYDILDDGTLRTISGMVPNLQSVPCWIVITDNQRFLYEANAVSSTISSYTVESNGTIALKESIAGTSGSFPGPGAIDIGLTLGSRYLYSLAGNGTITGFAVNADGTLTPLGSQANGLPPTVSGLAVR